LRAVTLTVVENDLEAEMLCGMLRANGIKCAYEKADAGGALAIYTASTQIGPTTVLVDETQLEEARKLLRESQ
jgi:hypothetical protein